MDCPKCGYEMEPFDAECQRCRRMGGAVPPRRLPVIPLASVADPFLSALAFVGCTLAGSGVGHTFGNMLHECIGGG